VRPDVEAHKRLVGELKEALRAFEQLGDHTSSRIAELMLLSMLSPNLGTQRHLKALEPVLHAMLEKKESVGLEFIASELLVLAYGSRNEDLQKGVYALLDKAPPESYQATGERLFTMAMWRTDQGQLEQAEESAMALSTLSAKLGNYAAGAAAMHALAWIHVAAGRATLAAECAAQEAKYRLKAGDKEAAAYAALAASRVEGVALDELLLELAERLREDENTRLVLKLLDAAATRLARSEAHQKALKTLLKAADMAGEIDEAELEASLYLRASQSAHFLGDTRGAENFRRRAELLVD